MTRRYGNNDEQRSVQDVHEHVRRHFHTDLVQKSRLGKRSIETGDEAETALFACEFSENIVSGDIILLHGDLGAGKSVFSRALIRTLCGDERLHVPSPTFTLVQTYDSDRGMIRHFDLYRLSDISEIHELGWEEALEGGIALVEWPERLGLLTPRPCIDVTLSFVDDKPHKRRITVQHHA